MKTKQLMAICWMAGMLAMSGVAASIQTANIFSSGCVLQRGHTVPVWGTCTPGDTVTVEINGQSKQTTADAGGKWRVELDSEAAGGPYTMLISASNSPSVLLTDVYFGDVWILTGQSNMFETLGGTVATFPDDYPAVPDATDDFDDVRFAIVGTVASSNAPAEDVAMSQTWSRWQASRLGNMSAVGYFFARALNSALDANGQQGVPLGFIKVCVGGTAAEQWVSAEALAAMGEPLFPATALPSGYYNGMIAPIQDYPIKGALWYQGEGNAQPIGRIDQYPLLMQTLIESWRTQWNNPGMPFYYVQLAPYNVYSRVPWDEYWPWLRESQTECLAVTNTGMACIIEGGLQGNIHPPFKDRVGARLARIALADTYGISQVTRGPALASYQFSGTDAVITLGHVAGGLQTQSVDSQPDADEVAAGFPAVSVSSNELAGFALCGTNQIFYWATDAEIVGTNQVRVSNAVDVPNPVAVRYAWQNYPRCNLFNSEGLPAEPFRTDTYGYSTSSGAMISTPVSTIIYQDDFSGSAGVSTAGSPEVSPVGFEQKGWETGLDGNGHLESILYNSSPGYRVKLGTNPLTDDPAIGEIKLTVTMRTPTNDWVMIGFQGQDANGMLFADRNVGPMVLFNPTSVQLRGGTWGGGTNSSYIAGAYVLGSVITAEMTYHVGDQTLDLAINGSPVANGFVLNHEFPVGAPSDPAVYWAQIQFFFQPSAADGGAYIDSLQIETTPAEPGTTIYQDDFGGAAGAATTTVPEVSPTGFVQKYFQTGLDGNGRLESTNPIQASAGYRVKLGTDPLTANPAIADIKYKVMMRTPTNNWVMIGFQEADANGFLTAANNVGPIVMFTPTSVILRGGTWGGGIVSKTIMNTYHSGQIITAEMTYHIATQTMDLVINGLVFMEGFVLGHEYPIGTPAAPVVYWAQIQFFAQPSAANGGPYIDSFQIQATTPALVVVPGYAGWAAGWGVDIGATTNDYDGDGFSNLYEYGLGGDPTNAFVQGTPPVFGMGNSGGTNYFSYIYPQLSDTNSGLSYSLALRGDLIVGDWVTNVGYVVTGTNVTGGTLDFVSNVTDTVDGKKFVRLIIE